MACEDRIAGLLAINGDLAMTIGNEPFSEQRNVWEPWPNDFWRISGSSKNYTAEAEGGVLYITPDDPRATFAILSLFANDDHSLIDNSLTWRMKPMQGPSPYSIMQFNDDPFETDIIIEIIGTTVDLNIYDGTTYQQASFTYDEDLHRWWRIRHTSSPAKYFIDTAGGCPKTWTNRLSAGVSASATPGDLGTFFYQEVDDPAGASDELGYWGPLNQQAVELTGSLTTGILPLPKVAGLLALVGDLVTDVEEVVP